MGGREPRRGEEREEEVWGMKYALLGYQGSGTG